MASVILQHMNRRPAAPAAESAVPDEASSVIARMERSLGHSPGDPV